VSLLRASADAVRSILAPFPLLTRLTRAAGWTTLGTLVGNGLTFVAMIAVARLLGRDRFGELGILQSTVVMFQAFASVGLGMTAMKHVAEYRAKEPVRAGHIIAISDLAAIISGGAAAMIVYAFAPWLAAHALVRPEITPLLRIAAITIALSSLTGAMNGTLGGMEEFRSIAVISLVSGLAAFPLILAGVLWKGVEGVVLALAAQALLTCVLVYWMARRKAKRHHIPITLRGAREWPVLWRFSVPAMLSGIMVTPAEWLCNSILVRHGGGYSAMGIYAAAMQWRNLLMFLPIMIVQSALPVFASVKSSHGPQSEEFSRLIVVSQNAIMLLIFPVATLLMFLAHGILGLYGASYSVGSMVLVAVCFMVTIQCTGAGLGPAIEAWGNMWAPAAFNFFWALLYVLFAWRGVARWGAAALPFGAAVAYFALTYIYLVYFRGRFPKGTTIRMTRAMLAATVVVAFCSVIPVRLRFWLSLPASIIVFLMAVLFFSDRALIGGPILRSWTTLITVWKGRDKEVL
jgi:O-antigen/teichoic acid export membrane protein